MGVEAVATFLKTHGSFIATTHTRADGDAIASVLAVAACLGRLGRPCRIIIPDERPQAALSFLPGIEAVEGVAALRGGIEAEAAVVVDAPNLERVGAVRAHLPPMERVANIDHHPSNVGFGGAVLVEPEASSTAELVYEVVRHLGLEVDREMAVLIYTGILYDTGRFSHSNTSPRAMTIASEMISLGVEPSEVSRALYYERPAADLRALGHCLERLELHAGGRVSLMAVPNALYRADPAHELDTEGFVDAALGVGGVEVACLLKEERPGTVRVSLRSKGPLDVDALARRFDGGGHVKAAGCVVVGTLDEAKAKLLEALEGALGNK